MAKTSKAQLRGATLKERLLHYSIPEPNSGCWLWTGALDKDGYGLTNEGGKQKRAHRAAYEVFIGPVPAELVIDHLCRVHSCINPCHLEIVTTKENILRGITGQLKNRSHCDAGHEFTEQNTAYDRKGYRYCRKCKRARTRATETRNPAMKKAQQRRTYLRRKERGLTARPPRLGAAASMEKAEPSGPAGQLPDLSPLASMEE